MRHFRRCSLVVDPPKLTRSYAAYDEHPPDEPDEWGDLASWRQAAGASESLPARGEVWWCELAEIGRRPVVVEAPL